MKAYNIFRLYILINKVFFFFASLGVSASEGAAVVRPDPCGPCGPRMRRSRLLSVSCAFLCVFWRDPSRGASQCRSVFPQKVRICDIFRGFTARFGPGEIVFLAESPPSCRFSACFAACNVLVFSQKAKKRIFLKKSC